MRPTIRANAPGSIVLAVALPALLLLVAGCRASSSPGASGPQSAASGASQPTRPSGAVATGAQSLGTNLLTLSFKSASGAKAELHVRVEATEPLREQGLMSITNLPEDQGDLFTWQDVFPNQDVFSPFWMKDTKIPLSIAFVAADGRIMEEQDMAAETLTYHIPRLPYRYAIEANLGWYDRHGMPAGSLVSLPASLLPPPPASATPAR